MTPTRIAICGAHSQGKTTLVDDLMMRPEFKTFTALTNLTRSIREKGININELGSDWSQALVIGKHIERDFIKGNVLFDRWILDGVVYTDVLHKMGKVSTEILNFATWMFDLMIRRNPDINIFYVVPELPLAKDNVRSEDRDFFNSVVDTFEKYIKMYNIKVTRLYGSREARVQTVINTAKLNS